MSGRPQGKGGRGSKNNGRNKNFGGKGNGGPNRPPKVPDRELKFAPQTQGNRNFASFATVKEAVVTHIQKTFKGGHDVAKSLKDMVVVDYVTNRPVRRISTLDAADPGRAQDQRGLDNDYNSDKKRWDDKKDLLDENMFKAYSLVKDNYCTVTMQLRLEELPNYTTVIDDDPIALLTAIQSLLHDPVRAQNPTVSRYEALKRLVGIQQYEGEQLLDYSKRFKQTRDIMHAHLGEGIMDGAVALLPAYIAEQDAAAKKAMRKEEAKAFLAYLFLAGSDQTKYGSLLKGFQAQFSLGNDQYPRTLEVALDVLSSHRFDQKYSDNQRKNREHNKQNDKRNERDGKKEDGLNTSFAQQGNSNKPRLCFVCGEPGHLSPNCKHKNLPRDQWFSYKAMQHVQSGAAGAAVPPPAEVEAEMDGDDDVSVTSSRSARSTTSRAARRSGGEPSATQYRSFTRAPDGTVSWSMFQNGDTDIGAEGLSLQQSGKFDHLKNSFLIDCASTIGATICNPDMITGIHVSPTPILMSTNAGTKKINLEGTVEGFGTAYYAPDMVANIFSLSKMAKKHHVTYDSWKEDAILVHKEEGLVKFVETDDGLFAYTPSDEFLAKVADQKKLLPPKNPRGPKHRRGPPKLVHPSGARRVNSSHLIASVAENRKHFTERQFKDAKVARDLAHTMGCPTIESLKHLIRQKLMKNCPVTTVDVNIAEKIFGPDVGAIKGKWTRSRPAPVREDLVEIPPEILEQHQSLVYCMDLMFVNGKPTLTGIDRSVKYRSSVPLDSRTTPVLYSAVDKILRFYNGASFRIKQINCDQEFKPLMDPIKDEMEVDMNYANAQDHEPTAERNNRTIGERMRSIFHNLPFKSIPRVMLDYLTLVATMYLNFFPAKGGVSPYYSPYVIMTQQDLDYQKHCKIAFGAYVQAFQENKPSNTLEARAIDGIYLRPVMNKQGGHEVMNLATGLVITLIALVAASACSFSFAT